MSFSSKTLLRGAGLLRWGRSISAWNWAPLSIHWMIIFTYIPCILIIIKVFFYQLMHNWIVLKTTYGMKTNWCHYFIRILLDLYMFRAHRPIFRRVRTAVHTTIGSVSVPLCSRALYVVACLGDYSLHYKKLKICLQYSCYLVGSFPSFTSI